MNTFISNEIRGLKHFAVGLANRLIILGIDLVCLCVLVLITGGTIGWSYFFVMLFHFITNRSLLGGYDMKVYHL